MEPLLKFAVRQHYISIPNHLKNYQENFEIANYFPENPNIDLENIILRQTWSITSQYILQK